MSCAAHYEPEEYEVPFELQDAGIGSLVKLFFVNVLLWLCLNNYVSSKKDLATMRILQHPVRDFMASLNSEKL